jgi:hypothetical protein
MNVILAANRSLPLAAVAHHVLRELASLPLDATVLLRRPREANPAAFETFVAGLCADLGISVEWRMAEADRGTGRSATYSRDVDMAIAADAAICYFDAGTPMDGGTGHLAERCIEEEVPLKCYVYDPEAHALDLIGTVEDEVTA